MARIFKKKKTGLILVLGITCLFGYFLFENFGAQAQRELNLIKEVKLSKAFSLEAQKKEKHLLKDLEEVERYIGKEVFDIEKELA